MRRMTSMHCCSDAGASYTAKSPLQNRSFQFAKLREIKIKAFSIVLADCCYIIIAAVPYLSRRSKPRNPILRPAMLCFKILPSWSPFCPDGSSFCLLFSSGPENGCFGVGFGMFCVRTYPRKEFVTAEQRTGVGGHGWYSGQSETLPGQKETHLCEKKATVL